MRSGFIWAGFRRYVRKAAPAVEPPVEVDAEVELYRWHDFPVEAEVAGNKYDAEASVLWQHEGGTQRQGLAWYAGSGDTFVFRFGAEVRGRWTGTTSSAVPELDGLTFVLDVVESGNPERIGFSGRLPGEPVAWARQKGPDGTLVKRTPRLIMWDHPRRFWNDLAKMAADVAEFADDHGFNGAHIPSIARGWWDVTTNGNVSTGLTNPDVRTFAALEALITAWAERGGWVHFWQYGDGNATFHGLNGGHQGAVSRRLNRYIAARLGPVPGWAMGIGYDLDEWLSQSQFAWWLDDIVPKLGGYHHWIGGRYSVGGDPGPVNEGQYPSAGITWNTLRSDMQYATWEQWQTLTSDSEIDQGLQVVPGRPMCSEDRFRRRNNAWPQKDFGADGEILACMERFAVRGVSAIYGRYINQTDTFRISDVWPNKADILALAQQIDDDGEVAGPGDPGDPGQPGALPETLPNLIFGVDPERSPLTFGSGSTVSQIDDLGSGGKHFGQGDPGLRPTLEAAGIQGGAALRGQSNAYLYRTEALCWPAGDFAIYFLIRAPSQSTNRFYSEGNSGSNTPYWALDANGNKLRVRIQTDGGSLIADATTNATVFDDQPHIVCVSKSGGTGQVWVDGVADVTFTTAGTLTLDRSALLARLRSTADFLFNGRLGPVYAYGEARSSQQAEVVEGYLAAYPDAPAGDPGGGNGDGGDGGDGGGNGGEPLTLTRENNRFLLNGVEISRFGLRAANALQSATITNDFIDHFDVMRAHGIQSVAISMQGGRFTEGGNSNMNAYNSDGTIKPEFAGRLAAVLDAAAARNMVVVVMYFYRGRDQELANANAVRKAVEETTAFIKPWRNAWVHMINEWYHSGYDHNILRTSSGQVELYNLAKSIDPDRILHVSPASGANDGFGSDTGTTAPNNGPGGSGAVVVEYVRGDSYDQAGVFTSSQRSNAQSHAETAFTGGLYWFWHAAWHQKADASGWPRWGKGGAGTSADPGVSFAWDKMSELAAVAPAEPTGMLFAVHDSNNQPAAIWSYMRWLDDQPQETFTHWDNHTNDSGIVTGRQDVIRRGVGWDGIEMSPSWDRANMNNLRQWALSKPGRWINLSQAIIPNTHWGQLQQAANGDFDHHFTNLSNNLAEHGLADPNILVIFRPGYEFNANFFPWGISHNMTNAGFFREFWKRIIDIMRNAYPSANWKFDWNPTHDLYFNNFPVLADEAYPGSDYVDFVGIDIYDRGGDIKPCADNLIPRWQWAENRLNRARDYAIAKGKPLSIGEWGIWNNFCDASWGSSIDNPFHVEMMHGWITANAAHIGYHCHFNELHHHNLNPHGGFEHRSPLSSAKFKELFGPAGN